MATKSCCLEGGKMCIAREDVCLVWLERPRWNIRWNFCPVSTCADGNEDDTMQTARIWPEGVDGKSRNGEMKEKKRQKAKQRTELDTQHQSYEARSYFPFRWDPPKACRSPLFPSSLNKCVFVVWHSFLQLGVRFRVSPPPSPEAIIAHRRRRHHCS